MIARALEEEGLSTTSISLLREHTEHVKPPRALFVPFPFGAPLGRPDDPELQTRVLRAALALLEEPSGPALVDFPEDDATDRAPAPIQASMVKPAEVSEDPAMETTRMRRYYEQWVEQRGRTLVGLTRIPPTRFRGVVRFLEAFADGKEADMPERPAELALPLWIRHCVDDLKAMYFEGRLAMKPDTTGEEFARWFWGETALGRLVVRVKERMEAADDPRMQAAGFGIAR